MTDSATPPTALKRFLWYHLPALAYAGAIIAISTIPNLRTPEVTGVALDKLAHFIEYAVFAFLAFRAFAHLTPTIRVNSAYLLTILFVSLFALLDEYVQSFIPGRTMDGFDLAMDLLGACLVATFFWLRRRRLQARPASPAE